MVRWTMLCRFDQRWRVIYLWIAGGLDNKCVMCWKLLWLLCCWIRDWKKHELLGKPMIELRMKEIAECYKFVECLELFIVVFII